MFTNYCFELAMKDTNDFMMMIMKEQLSEM